MPLPFLILGKVLHAMVLKGAGKKAASRTAHGAVKASTPRPKVGGNENRVDLDVEVELEGQPDDDDKSE